MGDIEIQLKEMICQRFHSVKEFAAIVDIPYTTVDSILKRGVEKANVVNIIKICIKLGIDTDALIFGEIKKKQSHYPLTETELINAIESRYGEITSKVFSMYLQLDDGDRGEIRGEMKNMLKADKYSISKELKNA